MEKLERAWKAMRKDVGFISGPAVSAKFCGDKVVSPWICFDRQTGQKLWENRSIPADSMAGVAGQTLIGTNFGVEGAASVNYGVVGISLEDGSLLWVSHADGLRALLAKLPIIGRQFQDWPHTIRKEKVLCASGRVLDAATGRTLSIEAPPDALLERDGRFIYIGPAYELPDGGSVRLNNVDNGLAFIGFDPDGKERWRKPATNVDPLSYMADLGRLNYVTYPIPGSGPTYVAFNGITGEEVAHYDLPRARDDYRIMDLDEEGLLLESGTDTLHYFRWPR
jgi:outer membrane protein assembly factor BamB